MSNAPFFSTTLKTSETAEVTSTQSDMDDNTKTNSPEHSEPLTAAITTEIVAQIISIPEYAVPLVVGRGGSEIKDIESETGCRVQLSAKVGPRYGARQCTLEGSEMAIERAKRVIAAIVASAPCQSTTLDLLLTARVTTVEMIIPATKCTLVLSQLGERVKEIEKETRCEIVMMQSPGEVTGQARALRITGGPKKVEIAKRLVTALLNSQDNNNNSISSHYSEQTNEEREVVDPRAGVGMIFDEGEDTADKPELETGTEIQFRADVTPNKNEKEDEDAKADRKENRAEESESENKSKISEKQGADSYIKVQAKELNPHLTCALCKGYLIDATAVTKCLHAFCKSCILKYFEEGKNTCPTCGQLIHKKHPSRYVAPDRILQNVVYEIVPGLLEAEQKRRLEFFQEKKQKAVEDVKNEETAGDKDKRMP